jgi:hypothetical protein
LVDHGRCCPDGLPVERYLAFLTDVDRLPNTVKAYVHGLKDWFVFLAGRALDWREVRLEDVGEFVAWLRLQPAAWDGRVAVLPAQSDTTTPGRSCQSDCVELPITADTARR